MKRPVLLPRTALLSALAALGLLVVGSNQALAEAAHNGGLPQFDPSFILTQLFWLTLIFGTFYLLIQGVAVPKVIEVIETRDAKIAHDIKLAEEARNEVTKVGRVIEDKIVLARDHARTILHLANREAGNVAAARIAMFDSRIASRVRDAELRISHARQDIFRELPAIAGALVGEVVTHFVTEDVDQNKVSSAVDRTLKDRATV